MKLVPLRIRSSSVAVFMLILAAEGQTILLRSAGAAL